MTTTSAYVRDLLRRPALTVEVEHRLARAARAGDPAAREELICGSLRLVALRARMLGFAGDTLDDAVQAGTVALIDAIDRFDPDRGVRLGTFVWWPLARAMRAAVPPAHAPLEVDVPVPADADVVLPEVPEVLRLRFRIDEEPGPPRSRHEVAQALGLSVGQVRRHEGEALHRVRRDLARILDRAPR